MRPVRLLPFWLFVWCAVLGAQIDPRAALIDGPRGRRSTPDGRTRRPTASAKRLRRIRRTPASIWAPANDCSPPAPALAARRLLDEAGGFAVANLLRDLGEGTNFETAFLHRFQRPFADFQAIDGK